MSVTAVYRNGVFVPKEKIDLEENTEVRVILVSSPGGKRSAWERHTLHLGAVPAEDFKAPIEEMEVRAFTGLLD